MLWMPAERFSRLPFTTTRPGVDLNLVEVVAPERAESGAGECWKFGRFGGPRVDATSDVERLYQRSGL